jgi:type I restriction enzyme S subunit
MTSREVQLKDVLDIQWGDTKTTKASYVPEGYLAYSATGPDGFLEKFDYDREGIILSAIGANCGSTFFASGKWSCIKNTIRIFPKSEEIDLKYFFYMTKAKDFWPIRGSAQPFISQTDIRELYVHIPEIKIQRKIGEILYTLEKKISVNSELSKTLENIAQTIFKSWFIDFDPVKAKMAGEKPEGMDDATAALFPDSMEESELGLIPEGWNVSGLNEFAKPRKELAKVSSLDSQTNYVGLEHLPRNSLFFRTWSSAEKVQSGKSVFRRNDILFGKLRPYFHKVVVSPVSGVCSTDIVVIQSPDSKIDPYTACLVNQDEFITFVTNRSSGTRMPRTSWQEMCEFRIAFPGLDLMQKFNELMEPLFLFAISVCLESNELETIRETLLPRLISGELQIPEEMLAS